MGDQETEAAGTELTACEREVEYQFGIQPPLGIAIAMADDPLHDFPG